LFELQTILLFITISALLTTTPGPDIILVMTRSMSKGAKDGIFITLGLCSGLVFHTTAVALGVAAVFETSILAFNVLKYIGAAYLLYLAYLSFTANSKTKLVKLKSELSAFKLYRLGIFMNITNPKVIIFFLAFFPQFTNPDSGSIAIQIFILGAMLIVCAFTIFSLIALLAGKLGGWFNKSKYAEIVLNRIAGTLFAGFAVKLVLSER